MAFKHFEATMNAGLNLKEKTMEKNTLFERHLKEKKNQKHRKIILLFLKSHFVNLTYQVKTFSVHFYLS